MKRFWKKVDKTETCWNWIASLRNGYGAFRYKGRIIDAHRFVWFLIYNKWPEKWILHKCDNRKCVNPDHLFEGTPRDNVMDALNKGRMISPYKYKKQVFGVKHGLAKLTPEIVENIRRDYLAEKTSYRQLAKKYNVVFGTIRSVIKFYTWKYARLVE